MSKRIIYLLLAVSLGLNAGVIATTLVHRASMPPPGPPPGPDGGAGPDMGPPPDPNRLVEEHVRGITRHLDLDAAQQDAVRLVLERHSSLLVELQMDVGDVGRRLSDAFAAPEFDPEQFRRLTAEAGMVRSRLDSLSAEMLVAEAAVLTPEQRRKFAAVAPTIHSQPQRPPREGGPPPR